MAFRGPLTRSPPPRYDCREEFQVHEELRKAHYTLGRLRDTTPEHYLVQVRPALPQPPCLPSCPGPSPSSPSTLLLFLLGPPWCFTPSWRPAASSPLPPFALLVSPFLLSCGSCSSFPVRSLPGPGLPSPLPQAPGQRRWGLVAQTPQAGSLPPVLLRVLELL